MNKVLVKLYVPTIEEQYDIWIPGDRKIYSAIKLISRTINELTYGEYNPKKLPVLYDKKTGEVYDINKTIEEVEIKSGSELILI